MLGSPRHCSKKGQFLASPENLRALISWISATFAAYFGFQGFNAFPKVLLADAMAVVGLACCLVSAYLMVKECRILRG